MHLFDTGPVYAALRESLADIVILQGGTDSGKTYATIQRFAEIAVTTDAPKVDPVITILSESVPNSKKGAYRTAEGIFKDNPYIMSKITDWNETDRTITFSTGWVMEFVGATDEQNAKQGKRQYLFVNEANGVAWKIFWQYAKRTRIQTVVDYNPSEPFWPHENLIGTTPESNDLGAVVQLIISDHRHNPFLSAKDHEKTENIKDPELWKVYARGLTGNLSGIIYSDWKEVPDKDYPWKDDNKFGGLDFGYTNDPTAAVMCVRIGKNIYVHELCYESGLTNTQIMLMFKAVGMTRPEVDEDSEEDVKDAPHIYCEHDPDAIRDLRGKQKLMVRPARKGPGSIKAGIAKVKEYNIFYTSSSKNLIEERKKYMWEVDKSTGKFTNTPIDLNNHLMDAIRYAIYSRYYRED